MAVAMGCAFLAAFGSVLLEAERLLTRIAANSACSLSDQFRKGSEITAIQLK
jgi:hypothetical protein